MRLLFTFKVMSKYMFFIIKVNDIIIVENNILCYNLCGFSP